METSIFLAKIISVYLIVAAIGILFNLKTYQKVMEDFFKNAALIYLGGAFALVIGLLIVLSHNVWVTNWQVIITIFGWLGLLKGIWLIVLPNTAVKISHPYLKKPALLVVHSCVILAFGVLLAIFGFFPG